MAANSTAASTRCTASSSTKVAVRPAIKSAGGSRARAAAPANRSATALPARSSEDKPRAAASASVVWPLTQRAVKCPQRQCAAMASHKSACAQPAKSAPLNNAATPEATKRESVMTSNGDDAKLTAHTAAVNSARCAVWAPSTVPLCSRAAWPRLPSNNRPQPARAKSESVG